ncbi:MAG: rane protein [Glaciihabitans sp.]|jgi:putative membrane protein|nr:rane protein [Glaciihabitans sp.]MCU1535629.1 rane protein [Glaciihabitans sp.]MDQ1555056.1 putative rane protein [Actinomycetota bacterium]
MSALLTVGSVFAFIAAVIHLFIFFLESIAWSKPSTWKRFGITSQAEADTLRPMAFNQGFYNVFLAIGAGVGLIMIGSNTMRTGGIAIEIFALGSMLLASVVLVVSNPRLLRAAALQGAAPLLGIVFLGIALSSS